MKTGDLVKEKTEYLKERYTTKSGIYDLLLGTAIYGFLIVNYSAQAFAYVNEKLPLDESFLKKYLAFLVFGLLATLIGLGISIVIQKIMIKDD